MQHFEFMKAAFFALCSTVCIAASVFVVYVTIATILKLITGGKQTDGRKQGKNGNQDRS